MISDFVKRSPGVYLAAMENPGKLELRDRLMKTVRSVIASNGVPYLKISSVGSHSISEMNKEGKDILPISLLSDNGLIGLLVKTKLEVLNVIPNIYNFEISFSAFGLMTGILT